MSTLSTTPPWYTHLTLDLLLVVLHRTLLHPFVAWMLPLSLRAMAAPYHALSFILTTAYASTVTLFYVFSSFNQRLAYGAPRNVDLEEEVIVITGGARGLGLCVAEIYGIRGVAVAVLDLDIGKMGDGEGEGGVKYYKCDVGNRAQVEMVWGRVVKDVRLSCQYLWDNAIVILLMLSGLAGDTDCADQQCGGSAWETLSGYGNGGCGKVSSPFFLLSQRLRRSPPHAELTKTLQVLQYKHPLPLPPHLPLPFPSPLPPLWRDTDNNFVRPGPPWRLAPKCLHRLQSRHLSIPLLLDR